MPLITFSIGFILIVFLLVYFTVLRSMQLRWGAIDDEISSSMSGDVIVHKPSFNATRAVTIFALTEYISLDLLNGYYAGWVV